ncbi:gluconate 2-dehydrogenase subunit 3 family protein [Nonomuraea purpurea]|uniref:Gluconate 2-dehydrogenase subunit 3 family protein n=1 Tax=Nonomuraea purpurea TaxID=1849276 RepID=A0ABV8GB71_9ACTN
MKLEKFEELRITVPGGYGNDPNLVTPETPWPRTLQPRERELVAALADVLLPGTAEYPAPSAMGIVGFFDDWVSAPYATQQKDRTIIVDGLGNLDEEAHRRFGTGFVEIDDDRRRAIVDDLVAAPAASTQRKFFTKFRGRLFGGYFTSDLGMKAIGYQGNVPLRSFPEVDPEVRRIIEDELAKLWL